MDIAQNSSDLPKANHNYEASDAVSETSNGSFHSISRVSSNESILNTFVDFFSRQTSPIHWTTLSDTIAVSPAALPILRAASNIEISNPVLQQQPSRHTPFRCLSVPNLDEEKRKCSDEEVKQMRDRLLNFARSRAFLKQLSGVQKKALFIISLCYFMSFCAISVLAPFFPHIAISRDITSTTSGLIFSVHAFVVFCTSPFIGQIIPSIGPKFTFICGVFLCGTCNLLFGILESVQDDTQFVMLCFIVRGLSAVGASAFSTAGATFVADLFPEKISAVMGILETFIGLGFSVGPAIGGVLYTLGGFGLPFYSLGGLMLLTLPFNIVLLPETQHLQQQKYGPSCLALFKMPSVILVCLVVAVSSSAWSVLDPTLAIHMKQFHLSSDQVGLLFLLTSASYALSSPLWGWLADKYDNGNSMMFSGLVLTSFGLLLLGPSPFLPGIPKKVGCISGVSTYSVIAGLWASMYSLGEVIGPSLGGFLLNMYDFPMAMTVVGFLNLAVAVLLFIYQAIIYIRRKSGTGTTSPNRGLRRILGSSTNVPEDMGSFIKGEADNSSPTCASREVDSLLSLEQGASYGAIKQSTSA